MREAILLKIIILLTGFILGNPNIPQETKDQVSQIISDNSVALRDDTVVEQATTTMSTTEVTPAVTPAVTPLTNNETTMSTPVEQITYVAGTVKVDGNKFIFDRNDSDVFRYKVTINGGKDYKRDKPSYVINDYLAQVPQTVETMDNDYSGTLWIFSSKNGQVLDEKTYNFSVENGVATLSNPTL